MGTSNHTAYDAEALNACRTARRTSKAATMAMLEAIVSVSRCFNTSFIIVNLRNQALQISDVTLRELAVAAEVRCEWCYAPSEKTIQQSLAFTQ
jgi:hypothetical protein